MNTAADRADALLGMIREAIALQEHAEQFPAPYVYAQGGGEVSIELIFDDFRMGFSVCPNPADSTWFIVATKRLGYTNAYGYLFALELQALIGWLVSFAGMGVELRR